MDENDRLPEDQLPAQIFAGGDTTSSAARTLYTLPTQPDVRASRATKPRGYWGWDKSRHDIVKKHPCLHATYLDTPSFVNFFLLLAKTSYSRRIPLENLSDGREQIGGMVPDNVTVLVHDVVNHGLNVRGPDSHESKPGRWLDRYLRGSRRHTSLQSDDIQAVEEARAVLCLFEKLCSHEVDLSSHTGKDGHSLEIHPASLAISFHAVSCMDRKENKHCLRAPSMGCHLPYLTLHT
ncbi:hypothetical protein OF83DRAFT_53960 [Amylostereum chailletii]|nr:hypothetical protein OF83DRAFT_53960 [Amylostereum chailletii]